METTTRDGAACAPAGKAGWLSRRTLYIGLTLAAGAGAFLGWDWLVAVGLSTVIIALAPCLVMCALGWCAMRMGGKKD